MYVHQKTNLQFCPIEYLSVAKQNRSKEKSITYQVYFLAPHIALCNSKYHVIHNLEYSSNGCFDVAL